jgi:hypothetical protein
MHMGKIKKAFVGSFVLVVAIAISGCAAQEAEVIKPVENLGLTTKAACQEANNYLDSLIDLADFQLQDPSNESIAISVGQTIANEGREILQLDVQDAEMRNYLKNIAEAQIKFGDHMQTAPEPYTAEWEVGSELFGELSDAYDSILPFCAAVE